MKRIVLTASTLILAISFVLAFVIKPVSANPGSILATGKWYYPETITASEVALKYGGPRWMQLITNGLKISEPATICHDFNGATLGTWEGEIRRLNRRNKWLPIDSYMVPATGEGLYRICADTPMAGTYALFAYYHTPADESPRQTAEPITTISGNSANGHWNNGSEFEINLYTMPAPNWLQFFSRGVEIENPTEICHPFEKGVKGWAAEIRRWNPETGVWTKLETTTRYDKGTNEGHYLACAQTWQAGTYALFGYLSEK